jgi:hypothetical protein
MPRTIVITGTSSGFAADALHGAAHDNADSTPQ